MKLQSGFAPVIILLIAAVGITMVFGGYSLFQSETASGPNTPISPATPTPASTITPLPKPTKIPLPTQQPVSPTPAVPAISFRINDNGTPITDPSLALTIKDEGNGQEQIIKNTSSAWFISNLNPGKYKFSISFPQDKYFNPIRNCEGCQNAQDVSNFTTCGYIVDFHAGDTIKISCGLRSTRPLGIPTSNTQASDTTAPTTNVYYPQPNGSIAYKIDGKICAITTAPTDDSSPSEVETEYKFDDGSWSGYAKGRAYLCADSLPNGPHTLSYHSKDKAGNVESTKTVGFTVNIVGN